MKTINKQLNPLKTKCWYCGTILTKRPKRYLLESTLWCKHCKTNRSKKEIEIMK